jgi:hypothetical protein
MPLSSIFANVFRLGPVYVSFSETARVGALVTPPRPRYPEKCGPNYNKRSIAA